MKSLIVFTWSAIEPITLMAFDCAFSVYGFFGRPACLGFNKIAQVIDKFVWYIQTNTGSSSISVNRSARLFDYPVAIHSECSHTMISEEDYRRFLLPIDQEWSMRHKPYGIHYCGKDPHRMASAFAEIERLAFLDVGWGGDVALLREYLPETFFNIRLNPVEIQRYTSEELRQNITERVKASGDDLTRTGLCCVNMDKDVSDERIHEIFTIADEIIQENKARATE